MIRFNVSGIPRAKQSFKFSRRGGYTPARTKSWQDAVSTAAWFAMQGKDKLVGDLAVELDFYLPNKRRVDIDNLSKGVLDGMNGIVYDDDCKVVDLYLHKRVNKIEPGVTVTIGLYKEGEYPEWRKENKHLSSLEVQRRD